MRCSLISLDYHQKMSKAQHILLVTPGFPSGQNDDTCLPYLQSYLTEVGKSGFEINFTVVALHYPKGQNKYNWNSIPVASIGGNNYESGNGAISRLITWSKTWRLMDQINRDNSVDAVHALWLGEATIIAQSWSKVRGVRCLATAMGQDVLSTNPFLKWVRRGVQMVALNERQAKLLRQNKSLDIDLTIIPWGVSELNEKSQNSLKYDILGVGSLTQNKAFNVFLRICARLLSEKPNLKIGIIGSGPCKEALETQSVHLGIAHKVQFLGSVSNAHVRKIMQQSSVLLHTAIYEGQGYVFEEALESGMTIVSTPVGGARESDGWFIGSSEEELIQGLNQALLFTPKLVHYHKAKATAMKYRDLYLELAAKRRPKRMQIHHSKELNE